MLNEMNDSSLAARLVLRRYMEIEIDDQVEVFESELNLCHALLDVAGPRPLSETIAKARLGYENALQWIGSVRDPIKLRRISGKLDRLRERLSANSHRSPARG